MPEAQDGPGEVMGDRQRPNDGGLPLICITALSKTQTSTLFGAGQGSRGKIVTHLNGLHDRLVQIWEAWEPEDHAVDQLRQLLQAAGPRIGVLLDQRGHHGRDVWEELREQSRIRLSSIYYPRQVGGQR